ncbi:hypothetical protein TNCV_2957421 [Trichonephila clavipes]|nr:hypothetical protein TNCV_2957421 [Trichonephila clavipes]
MESTGNEHHGLRYLSKFLKYGYASFVSDCDPVIKMLERTATTREDPEISEVLFIKNCLKACSIAISSLLKTEKKSGLRWKKEDIAPRFSL